MKVTYPDNIEVLLPDSNYNYAPFEYIDKLYLSTVNDSIFNYDEITYKFTSFNLDSIQFLKIPVFVTYLLCDNYCDKLVNWPYDYFSVFNILSISNNELK